MRQANLVFDEPPYQAEAPPRAAGMRQANLVFDEPATYQMEVSDDDAAEEPPPCRGETMSGRALALVAAASAAFLAAVAAVAVARAPAVWRDAVGAPGAQSFALAPAGNGSSSHTLKMIVAGVRDENRFVYFAATMRRPRSAADGAALGGLGGGFEQPLRLSVYGGGETASGAGAATLVRERALSATVAWRHGGDADATCEPFALWGTELLEYDRYEGRRRERGELAPRRG